MLNLGAQDFSIQQRIWRSPAVEISLGQLLSLFQGGAYPKASTDDLHVFFKLLTILSLPNL